MDLSKKNLVEELLKESPRSRDDDFYLILSFWNKYELSASEREICRPAFRLLVEKSKAGLISSSETIRRSRQILQRDQPELQGLSYVARQNKAVRIRKEIKR